MKTCKSTVPSVIVAVFVPATVVVGCPVAGRTSPAAPLADLHRNNGHGVGLTIPIVSPPGARLLHISFHRNTHGFTVGCEPSWDYEVSIVRSGCPDRRLKVWYDEHGTSLFSFSKPATFHCSRFFVCPF